MAQGAGASDPEPRALRGAATAPRVTSGPRGRAQAEADRARTPPGRPLQLIGSVGKSCACVGDGSTGRQRPAPPRAPPADGGGPRPGPGGQGALPRPHRGVRARAEGSAPAALRRGDLREHRPAAASRPLCIWTPFDIGPAPHGVSEFRLRRNASGKSLCVRRLRWETRRVRSAGPAATSGPVLVRPELSSVLPDVSRIPAPAPAAAPPPPPVCATPPRAPHVWKSLRVCPRDWLAPPSAVLLGPHVPQRVRVALVVRTEAPTSALARGTGR